MYFLRDRVSKVRITCAIRLAISFKGSKEYVVKARFSAGGKIKVPITQKFAISSTPIPL